MDVIQLPSAATTLIVMIDLPTARPDFAFACWITPELLTQWWPKIATIEARLNGSYQLTWPELQQTLRGVYTAFEPSSALSFTWRWDHEQERATPLVVRIAFEASNSGTK